LEHFVEPVGVEQSARRATITLAERMGVPVTFLPGAHGGWGADPHLAMVSAALDIQTGGGEVLAKAAKFPPTMAATESWPASVALATRRLHPLGVVVVADPDEPPLPFADDSFDLVTSRHPATVWWREIARVLRPGGTYLAQHVGPESVSELYEFFLGPQPKTQHPRHPDRESAEGAAAGLWIKTMRMEKLRVGSWTSGPSSISCGR
jgi:SAM-dependent methyltransferase